MRCWGERRGKDHGAECIEGLRRQDGGSAVVWGRAGIQLQSASLPAHIRPMEAVALFAKWNGTKPDAAMLDALGIGGMKNAVRRAVHRTKAAAASYCAHRKAGRGISG
ncbi:MAG: hypothetical protein ACLRZH_06135 [Ruthenibacterium lactatiformans]